VKELLKKSKMLWF